ncbi:TPA: hypothetical protein EYP38_03320 [Candidatus Micrarchaeota archaeon]|nr:hypothetical protein [Candidatus Micrarchaeota archaeon]
MLLGLLKPRYTQESPGEELETTQKPPEAVKSDSAENFLATPRARTFIKKWSEKKKNGKKAFTKRGVVSLLRALFMIPGLSSDDEVLDSAEELLGQLGGMDGLQGFLLGWKAKSEGLMKAVTTFVGGE